MEQTAGDRQVPVLAALGQGTRLRIVELVSDAGPKGVAAGEIARAMRCPASTLSFHLKELSQAGVLEARPRGRYLIYALRHRALSELAQFVAALDAGAAAAATGRGPARARSGRRQRAEARARDRDQLSMFGE